MNGFRDIEQLSGYLDGQLNPSDSARLESRLKSDPELASAFEDLRSARGILRKLPSRKAPRNFMLTRKMVGLKPPLPRAYPTFRFATVFATFLFAFTIAVNTVAPRLTSAPALTNLGSGGGCDGGCGGGPGIVFEAPFSAAVATEAPAATEAPVAAEMMPAPTEGIAPPSAAADTANTERITVTETPIAKEPVLESPGQSPVPQEAVVVIPVVWQVGLLIVSILGAVGLFLMDRFAKRKWQ